MLSRNRLLASAAGVSAMLLAACSSTPVKPTAAVAAPAPVTAPAPESPKPAPAPVASAPAALPDYLNPDSPIHRDRQVYFAFDTSAVDVKYGPMLDQHAAYLSGHQDVHVVVEGNCDERGSAEYNLALGERRAGAVVDQLEKRGVAAAQLDTRSWGKEKPVALGHEEDDWVQNRRADLVYPDH